MSSNMLGFFEQHMFLCHTLAWIGGLFSLYYGLKIIYKFYKLLRIYIFPTYLDFSKYGTWSVVTGAAGGIGKEIALQLASRGQNIILIDIDEEGLQKTSKEIASLHGVVTRHLQIDFSGDESIYENIEMFLKGYDIGVLVNNVGMAAPICNFIDTGNLSNVVTKLTRVNMLSAVKMIQLILPGMQHKRCGCIINVSSASSLHPAVTAALYGATKAFIRHLSLTLSYECEDKGIIIQCCCPYFLKTKLTNNLPTWKTMPGPKEYVKSMLATVGKERCTLGSLQFTIKNLIIDLIPPSILKYELYRRAALVDKQQ